MEFTAFQILILVGIIVEQVKNSLNKTNDCMFVGVLMGYGIFKAIQIVVESV